MAAWMARRLMEVRDPSERPRPRPTAVTLESLYREHFDFVYRLAARLGGPTIDAEDAAQEVFLIVGRKLDSYDGVSLPTTWLYGITLNVVRGLRRRARIRRLFERHEPTAEVAVESLDRAEVREAHRIAYQILDKIAPKKREAFILAEFEGLSCEEIGRVVGARTETVWSRLHYARQEFAKRLSARTGPRGEERL
jgi:RNA polymerase sigma-70 factor (ECF subfamily)